MLGEYQLAIEDYDKAIQLYPDYALPYDNRGYAHGKLGGFRNSYADYKTACALDYSFLGQY